MKLEAQITFNTDDVDSLKAAASNLKVLLEQVNKALNTKPDPAEYWMTYDEEHNLVPIRYKDMKDRHLANAMALLAKNSTDYNSPQFQALLSEAKVRWGSLPITYEEAYAANLCKRGVKTFLNKYLGTSEVKAVSVGYVLNRIHFNPEFISLIIKYKFGGS